MRVARPAGARDARHPISDRRPPGVAYHHQQSRAREKSHQQADEASADQPPALGGQRPAPVSGRAGHRRRGVGAGAHRDGDGGRGIG